jgi:hypothetical protein
MKQLTTLFVAVLCSSLSFGSFSQSESDCISTRWISVKDTEKNMELFNSLPEILTEIKRQTDNNLLHGDRELTEVGPLLDENGKSIIQTNQDGTQTLIYQDKTITLIQTDIPIIDEFGNYKTTILDDGSHSFVYPEPVNTSLNSDVPLSDNNGDVIIKTIDDGTQVFLYPTLIDFSIQSKTPIMDLSGDIVNHVYGNYTYYSISERAISEIRIVEVRGYNEETGDYTGELKVSRIGFCMNPAATMQERFWIDADTFFENMEIPEDSPWYSIIIEKKYTGFQFKQTPCK